MPSGVSVHHAEVLKLIVAAEESVQKARRAVDDLGNVGLYLSGFRSHLAADLLAGAANELRRMKIAVEEEQQP